jgi:hypothetical protein
MLTDGSTEYLDNQSSMTVQAIVARLDIYYWYVLRSSRQSSTKSPSSPTMIFKLTKYTPIFNDLHSETQWHHHCIASHRIASYKWGPDQSAISVLPR